MTLWLILVGITLVVLVCIALPLIRKTSAATQRVEYDIVVYRDQLAEVDKEVERGLLTPEQAEATRAEIYRRMLLAEDAEIEGLSPVTKNASPLWSRVTLALIILILVPLCTFLTYSYFGSPGLPGKPYAERKSDPDFTMATEAEKLAAELENNPSVDGYKRLADTYFMIHRYDLAQEAYSKVIGMNGGSASVWSELGEATTMAHDGLVVPEAHVAFTKALQFDAHDARARFYLGLAESQINEPQRAVAIWKDLEMDSSPDAPWLAMVKEHIAAFSKEGGFDPASIKPAPPSTKSPHDVMTKVPEVSNLSIDPSTIDPDAAAAVMSMKPDQQQVMIHKMVDRLADKMKANPQDRDGWLRLAQAYRVLGETDKAKEAEDKAAALQAK